MNYDPAAFRSQQVQQGLFGLGSGLLMHGLGNKQGLAQGFQSAQSAMDPRLAQQAQMMALQGRSTMFDMQQKEREAKLAEERSKMLAGALSPGSGGAPGTPPGPGGGSDIMSGGTGPTPLPRSPYEPMVSREKAAALIAAGVDPSKISSLMKPAQTPPTGYSYDRTTGGLAADPQWLKTQQDLRRSGGTKVNVNSGGPRIGTPPPGYAVQETPDGWVMNPVKGGPAWQKIEEEKKADAGKQASQQQAAGLVMEDIDRAVDIITNADFPVTGMGSLASFVPGTPQHDLGELLTTVKANIGFEKLQDMRDNSKTGGALGQVSEFENRLLQSVSGSLDQAQSKDQLLYNLNRIKEMKRIIVDGPTDPNTTPAQALVATMKPEDIESYISSRGGEDKLSQEEIDAFDQRLTALGFPAGN